MNVLDLLLKNKNINKAKFKEYEITRLSEECGDKVIFKVKPLDIETFNIVLESKENYRCLLINEAVVEPRMKDLMSAYDCATPIDVVKKLLLPGEAADLVREIEKLSGFHNVDLVKEVKK